MSEATSLPPVRFTISPKVVFWILAINAVIMAIAGFAAHMAIVRVDSDLIYTFAWQFDFDEEGNFANLYQSVTLLGCGGLLAIVGFIRRSIGGPRAMHWFVLAAVMAFVGIDEAAQIHEKTVNAFIGEISHTASAHATKADASEDGARHPFGFAKWMFVYLPVFAILMVAYLKFFFALPLWTRWGFFLSAFIYVGGAVGMELVCEKIVGAGGGETPLYFAMDNASEFFEMLGVAVFASTILAMLQCEGRALEVRFDRAE